MKLGINSYTFMWSIGFEGVNPAYPGLAAHPSQPLSALGLLEKASELGVRLVQTGPNLDISCLPEAELARFIASAQEKQIELELGTRGLDLAHIQKQVALAKRMRAKLIRTLPELNGQPVLDRKGLVPVLRDLAPLLEGEGLLLGIENGRIPAEELAGALEETGSARLGVVLDMVNSLAVAEGWKEVTRKLARHTLCLHYKDFSMRRAWHMMGFICEGRPAGQGMVETEWLLETLKASPFDFNVIVELWPSEQASVDETAALERAWAMESVAYLRRFIKD